VVARAPGHPTREAPPGRSHDGRAVYESTFSPVLDDDRRVVAATMTSRDITEQRERQTAERRAVAASKLDAAQLLIEADLAMYRAKAAGRDRIAVFAASERATAIHP
jgi:predicted signal transduction protein with EAL and GGDEF domain